MQRRGELWITELGIFASKNIKQRSLLSNKNSTDVVTRGCGKQKFVRSSLYVDESCGRKVCESTSGPSLVRHRGGMVLWAAILILQGAGFVGSMAGVPGVPENITVMFLNPTSVRVSWSTSQTDQVEKYDVTYKPTDARNETIDAYDAMYNQTHNETFTLSYNEPYNETYDEESAMVSYRMVRLVAGNSDAVTLTDLQADTQYQLVITAVRAGKKYRSRPIVFRTLEPPRTSPQHDATITGGPIPLPPSSQQPHAYIQVRGVEVGIVVMVLIVWVGAIALFFNRWGKIRMLLPYQPDYKEQLKVPGTGACAATTTTCTQHSSQHACSQHLHWSNHRVDSLDSATVGGGGGGVGGAGSSGGGGLGWPRSSRPRINSAIDVAGFLSQEFLRRHGSTSRLCRKVRSADNLPLTSCGNRQDDHRNSNDEIVEMDREMFLQTTNDEDDKTDDTESKRQSSLESGGIKDNTEVSLLEPIPQLSSPRECASSTITNISPSLISKRLGEWRVGGSHEYVKGPVRQSSIMDERLQRHSCEPDFTRLHHFHRRTSPVGHLFHYQSTDSDTHSRCRDYSKRTMGTSVETQHFGLPILSISEPSPPDERDRLDDYL